LLLLLAVLASKSCKQAEGGSINCMMAGWYAVLVVWRVECAALLCLLSVT